MIGIRTAARVLGELRRDITAAHERDPAARGVTGVEILATWQGVHALLAHRVAHALSEAGVLGPAAGVIGSLQALEALKLLAGLDGALLDAFLQVDLHDHTFLRVTTSRWADCPDCANL